MSSPAPYLAGLRLARRRVVVVGGGPVSARRVRGLLAAGADVELVAPQVVLELSTAAAAGRLRWTRRCWADGDLAGAWYAMAATGDPEVNAAVVAEAERARVFCVRADDAEGGSAWTPATGEVDGVQVAVLAGRRPREAVRVRDLLLGWLIRMSRRAA